MTMLEYLTTAGAKVIDDLISTSSLENPDPLQAAKFDNKPSWDNKKGGFDNRPSWDNWSKKK
ncbi:multiple cyclophane-containing RiPP AmcA [Streptosporangium sp. NPDC051023]|uniref:multiple cyclophane-containing RiPP AmcA n=1 Tax=Streptosporangium sp. NPDC051023 TaxID=3155410 RepID=UPI00344D765C